MAPKLDEKHHTFLQAIMNRGPLSERSVMQMFKSLVNSNSGHGFVPFLGDINKELEFVQMEVKKVMNQYDGKEFYGMINTLPSKEAKLGTRYSQAQIVFFTAVMEAIVQDPSASGCISSTAALNLKLDLQGESQVANSQVLAPIKMGMQAKQESLSLLVADQLLSRTSDGRVALGVKAFLELRSVFRNLEVPFCEVCNEAAIKAELCSNYDCPVRMHSYCFFRKLKAHNRPPKCSGCKMDWKQPLQEEDGASGEMEHIIPIATQQDCRPVQRKSAPVREQENVGVVGEEDENATAHVSFKRVRSRTTARPRIEAPAYEDDAVAPSEYENPSRKSRRRIL